MENKVLVAYASTHGSTQEVAEVIAAELRECGLAVDLQLVRNVRNLTGYGMVVLGAPIYMFHWHQDALHFLSRYREILVNDLPIAIFAGGPIEKGDEHEFRDIRERFNKELVKFPWLRPVSVEIIGGKFDPNRLHFPWNLIPALKQKPAIDLRDWTAIRAWASSLVQKLQPVMSR